MLVIPELLSADALSEVHRLLTDQDWEDGKRTAGGAAADVKFNLQLAPDPERKPVPAAKVVLEAMQSNELFLRFTMARKIRRPEFARYTQGMRYGPHIDSPLQSQSPAVRADLSCTVFLSDPEDYTGGELHILGTEEKKLKLPAGYAVVYSSDTLHQVLPVTSGERLVSVTWVQSYVRDPTMREILIDLDTATRMLNEEVPNSPLFHLVSRSRANLLRAKMEF